MTYPLHFSQLKKFAKSAKHYKDALDAPRECTRAMRVGTAVHRLSLGGTMPPVYEGKRQGSEWLRFARDANDSGVRTDEIMTTPEYVEAEAIATGLLTSPIAREYLADSRFEVPLKWSIGGRECETHGIDALATDAARYFRFGDLKSVPTCSERAVKRHCEAMLYHAQIAWYDMALDALGYPKRTAPPFLLCVEQKRPYDVIVLNLTPATLEAGRIICNGWLSELKVCEETGIWPGYSDAPWEWELFGADLEVDDGEVDE